MFDERVRAILPRAVGPIATWLVRLGVAPNVMSCASFGVALLAAAIVSGGHLRLGVLVWLLSRLGDGLDGLIARQTGAVSAFGGYLDVTLDMAAYCVMILGFALTRPDLGLAWAAILTTYTLSITSTLALSNAAGVAGLQVSQTNRTYQFTASLAEAGETSVMYGAWALFPGWMEPLAWVWCGLVLLSVARRTWLARQALSAARPPD